MQAAHPSCHSIPLPDQLAHLRAALLRTARARLRNPDWAEDAVSETLLAALEKQPDFSDQVRLRSWLFGILRHKVVDQLRRHLGDAAVWHEVDGTATDQGDMIDSSPQADPLRRAVDGQFVHALARQVGRLPALQARAFVMHDCWGHDTEAVCDALDISAGHLWVVLHRARQRLRQTLAAHQE